MTRKEIFAEMFSELDVSEQVECFNEFADHNRYARIESLDEYTINEQLAGMSPWDIINKYGDLDTSNDYFIEDVYVESYSDSEIVDYIEDYVDSIYDTDRFGDWVDEYELDDRCTEYFRGVIAEKYEDVDDDIVQEFLDEYYCNMDEDDENLEEFENLLKERNEVTE